MIARDAPLLDEFLCFLRLALLPKACLPSLQEELQISSTDSGAGASTSKFLDPCRSEAATLLDAPVSFPR